MVLRSEEAAGVADPAPGVADQVQREPHRPQEPDRISLSYAD
jgi:hypothetical protein